MTKISGPWPRRPWANSTSLVSPRDLKTDMEELAQVYARSLFQVALEKGRMDEIREQVGQFADALDEHRELAMFFFSPYFSSIEKQQSLSTPLDGADEILDKFLKLLMKTHTTPGT